MGHDTVLTPLGGCVMGTDGDRPFSERSHQPALRAVLSEDEEVHNVTIITRLLSLRFSPDTALAGAG